LDSAFRNLPKWGILAITTTDDVALHIGPEPALRNYGGYITRTFYSKELAVRLLLAAVARFVQTAQGPSIDAVIYKATLISSP
jgi:tRNA G26 N,N-dimethylase Trm1